MGSLKFDHDIENGSHPINPLDPDEFRRQGHMIIDFIANYYQNIERYQVLSQVEPGYLKKLLPESAPYHSLSTNPEFLRNKATDSKQVVDYKDWQITLSRRFRAMKLWLVLRSYGVGNLRNFLKNHAKMAKLFEELLRHDNRFEVVAPRNFALVCFRFLPWSNGGDNCYDVECANVQNQKLLESIYGSGQVYMSPTVVDKVYIIRCAIGATLTEERHVIGAWKVVQEYADALLSKY